MVVIILLNLEKRYIYAAAVLALILAFFIGMKYAEMRNRENTPEEIIVEQAGGEKDLEQKQEEDIQVYVTGAVVNPGVYRLQPDARVYEAINMAQALPDANLKNINMAQKLEDGLAIIVPLPGEESPTDIDSGVLISGNTLSGTGQTGKVNINTATAQELDDKLPGIGPTLAQRIVDYRSTHGKFTSIEGLNEVSGIGDKKYADLKDMITVR